MHSKCHELLTTLLLRGCPLDTLFRVFRKGLSGVEVFSAQSPSCVAPWVQLVSPQYFRGRAEGRAEGRAGGRARSYQDLEDGSAISLELAVLLAQPQPSWPLLLRVSPASPCPAASHT